MTLRKKAISIISGTMLGLCLVLAWLLGGRIVNSYSRLEQDDMADRVARATKGLQLSVDRLASTVGDWAPWYESYRFVRGQNPGYVGDNLTETAFANLGIDLVAFVDARGRIPWAMVYDREDKTLRPIPEEMRNLPDDSLLRHKTVRDVARGLFQFSGGRLAFLASASITTSDFSAPSAGSLIMGKLLDQAEVERVAEQTNLELSLLGTDPGTASPEQTEALAGLTGASPIFIKPQGGDRMAAYTLLRDFRGAPAALLKVSMSRSLFRQGRINLRYILLALAITALFTSFIIILIVDRLVLARLVRIETEVRRIGLGRDLKARLPEEGRDEFTDLSRTINSTLEALEGADLELKASLAEKELLLHEIHHRVKNNLQVVSSLLSLQSGITVDPGARDALRESQARIHSMALIHNFLYQGDAEGRTDLSQVGFLSYLHKLATYLAEAYLVEPSRIRFDISGKEIFLDADTAITCGLIINELVSNSLKHAFPEGRDGVVTITLGHKEGGTVTLGVGDDGIGFPPGMDLSHTASMGWQLITTLAHQLRAEIDLSLEDGKARGSRVRVSFLP